MKIAGEEFTRADNFSQLDDSFVVAAILSTVVIRSKPHFTETEGWGDQCDKQMIVQSFSMKVIENCEKNISAAPPRWAHSTKVMMADIFFFKKHLTAT